MVIVPFGLCNAPSHFQEYINSALHDYVDDIVVYTKDEDTKLHWDCVRRVLQRLQDAQLYCNLEKCRFLQRQIDFVGYIINKDGMGYTWTKPGCMQCVLDFQADTNKKPQKRSRISRILQLLIADL